MTPLVIRHSSYYTYSSPVTLGPQRLMLRPREGHDIRISSSTLDIDPFPEKVAWSRDMHGNSVATVTFPATPVTYLKIDSVVQLEHYDSAPLDFVVEDRAVMFPFMLNPSERIELTPYLTPVYNTDQNEVATWVREFIAPGARVETFVLLDQINRTIAETFAYEAREKPGVQRPSETLAQRSGSCRDFAALMIEACRYLGLPARFVSGYASTEDIPAALGATHAWAEVFLPGAGWKGFDSTAGALTGPKHIPVAVGRDPESLPPISGTYTTEFTGVQSILTVDVSVTREGLS